MAVVIASAFMVTRTVQAFVSSTSCNDSPVLLNVAVTADLAPSIERIARLFNDQRHVVAGSCAQVEVTQGESATEAAQIDGQQSSSGLPRVDAWIPESSLWVDVARSFPVGAQVVQPTGVDVARSPLMIVMPAAAAAATPAFGASVGWSFLLPQSVGGPSSALGLRVDLPDPAQSAAGLATLVQMGRLLGPGLTARADFTEFVFNSEVTSQFDDPASLASFVRLAAPPLNGHPVTITSEQAVVQYDEANPGQPLAARYPSGDDAQLGSPELNYPYVLTTSDPLKLQAAREFEAALQQPYAAAVVRYDGFRSANGVADSSTASFGLSGQILQLATPSGASEAQSTLQIWNKLGLGSRNLTLMDVSSAMDKPSGIGGQTLERELAQTAELGLALFPDSTHMGLWELASNLSPGKPYKQLVSVGSLPGELGLISRREQLQQIIEKLQPRPGSTLALHAAILAAYQHMVGDYQPRYANAVLVLTSGVDSDPGDISLTRLLSGLRALYSPARPVEIILIMFGKAGNFPALQQIAAATGGGAYEIANPAQIGTVFFEAVAKRMCDPGCAAP
jgi:hypothetical protein